MPEATLLYSVAAVVITGLTVWVGWALVTFKEPWARGPLADAPVPAPVAEAPEEPLDAPVRPHSDPDSTSRATPMALSEGKARAVREAEARASGETPAASSAEPPKSSS
jgi:hypothetical protein